MIGAERFILIGCLLQGALGSDWAVWMPQSIEALIGSCVLIPCRFEIPSEYDSDLLQDPSSVNGKWKKDETIVFDSSSQSASSLHGKITGDLLQKKCTTVLENLPMNYHGRYKFRLECNNRLKWNFKQSVQINITASPPKPKLTPERVEVMEGTSVSLSCSAAAPCPKLPPNLTWTPRLSDSVGQLQENVSVSSVLTFTASHLHHGQNITCRALYKLQQGDTQKTTEASLTLRVLYPPKNTSVSNSLSGSVLAGSSVTLTCSSNAKPAVQNYTWYKVNGTEMNTVGTGQNLTFNVTESSGSEQYYCEAQNEHGKDNSANVQLNVIYMPQISGSGSCSRTAAEISCSCESRGNPSPSMEWRVSGLRVTNSTDRVIREEQLGNTGLRSSLTMRQSQGDTPTLLCISTNTLGSSSLQLHLPSPQQHSGFGISSLLIAAAAGAGAMMMICLIMQHILKKKRDSQYSGSRMKDGEGLTLTDETAAQDEESIYANKTMLSEAGAVEKGDEGALHYATVDFSKLPGTGGEHGTGIVRGTSKRTPDYAVIRHKSREEREGGEEEGEEVQEEVEKEGQAELGTERDSAEARGKKEEESRPNLSPQASVNPEPTEEATYGNICRSRPTKRARQGLQQPPRNPAAEEEQEEQRQEENSAGGQEDIYVDVMSPLTEGNGKGTEESAYAEVRKPK
ncbi:myelin-associated glycoprotein-like isoform X14 [Anguilla rostrata]|uniref:myelin-associated glycoprotein-like isoform X14 n=1 Tax=Anguilla rostrata TaxID=7938 RepID=UPI0030D19414